MKQKIKFVKRFMSVVVAAVMVFATVAGIGNFFPNMKSEAATRQTLYICDIKSGGFSANYAGYTRLSIDRNAGNVNRGSGLGAICMYPLRKMRGCLSGKNYSVRSCKICRAWQYRCILKT